MKEYGKISETAVYSAETVIVGTGAAGFNAADLLHKGGAEDILIVTEGIKAGTSRNTGSVPQAFAVNTVYSPCRWANSRPAFFPLM